MSTEEKYIPRLLEEYRGNIVPQMKEKFKYANLLSVPRLNKIVVNMGVGEAINDQKLVEGAAADLAVITGQKAKICRARKAVSNFKLRKGLAIGCCVTMRGARMYEFLDRLITVAIPRIRDFRGFSAHAFDGGGNYNFGLLEQNVFPEISSDRTTRTQGMNITIQTTAKTDDEGKELLRLFGFPFRR
jgi:large subunit ribosomal protein L5